VNVRLHQGQATVLGATSPFSLMNADRALYGEGSRLWSGAEAAAFCKLYGLQDALLQQATHASTGDNRGVRDERECATAVSAVRARKSAAHRAVAHASRRERNA
jgi:hypothetical protein